MKKSIALLIALIFVISALSACNLFGIGIGGQQPTTPRIIIPTEGQTATEAAVVTEASVVETESPATESVIGTLDDYVRVAKQATSYFDGNEKTVRIPEIVINSDDADAANIEILNRFGEDVQEYTEYMPIISLDYEAYLSGKILSVVTTGRYDGGNSYGLCHVFDVTTGKALDSKDVCTAALTEYASAVSALSTNLTAYYDEKYSALPGNDSEREKTLADSNLSSAKMYLDNSGNLMALVDIYAAVGGGHWVAQISAQ